MAGFFLLPVSRQMSHECDATSLMMLWHIHYFS